MVFCSFLRLQCYFCCIFYDAFDINLWEKKICATYSEVATRSVLLEKVFLGISQNW